MPNVVQGTQKALFAYQINSSVATVLNPTIPASATGEIIIRVEWPAAGRFAVPNNPDTGNLDHEISVSQEGGASVRPVMAIPVGAVRWYPKNSGDSGATGTNAYEYPGTAISSKITSWATVHLGSSRQGIDIRIPTAGSSLGEAVMSGTIGAGIYFLKVLVQFSDGSQDDLWVRLMKPEHCKLSLNQAPPQFDSEFDFTHEGVANSSPEYTGIATYNISKAYVGRPTTNTPYAGTGTGSLGLANDWWSLSRSASDLGLASTQFSDPKFLPDDVQYTPFLQPWGAAVFSETKTPYSGLLGGWNTSDINNLAANNHGSDDFNNQVFSSTNQSTRVAWINSAYGDYTSSFESFALLANSPSSIWPSVKHLTAQHSFLSFVTGQFDNTWIYRGKGAQAGTSYYQAAIEHDNFQTGIINLNNFFGVSPQVNFDGTTTDPLGLPSWGLRYGWFAWTASCGLYKRGIDGPDNIDSMWGIPMFWAKDVSVPYTRMNGLGGNTDNNNIYALSMANTTGWGVDAADKMSDGFYGKMYRYIQVGDLVNAASGSVTGQYVDRNTIGTGDASYSNHFDRDNSATYGAYNYALLDYDVIPPQSLRWSRITAACKDVIYNNANSYNSTTFTTWLANRYMPGFGGGATGDGNLRAADIVDNGSNSFSPGTPAHSTPGNLVKQNNLSKSRNLYQPVPGGVGLHGFSASNNRLSHGGSLHDVRMNIGRNFFYTGGKKVGGSPVVPLFKGIVRTIYITNTNTWGPGEDIFSRLRWRMNAMAVETFEPNNGIVIQPLVTPSTGIQHTPVTYLDFYGVYHALDTYGTSNFDKLNPHSPWDLYSSLIYAGFTYGNSGLPTQLLGLNADVSPGAGDADVAVGLHADNRISNVAINTFKDGDWLDENGISRMFANDISFMLYGYAPIKEGTIPFAGSHSEEKYELTANHPVGSTYRSKNEVGLPVDPESEQQSDKKLLSDNLTDLGGGPFLLSVSGTVPYLNDGETDGGGDLGGTGYTYAVYPYLYQVYNVVSDLTMDIAATNMAARTNGSQGSSSSIFSSYNTGYRGIVGGSYLGYALPTYRHPGELDNKIVSAGTGDCMQVTGMYCSIANLGIDGSEWGSTNPGGTGQGYPIFDQITAGDFIGSQGLQFEFLMRYKNTCSGEFETVAGSKIVNTGTVGQKVTGVLEIFNHIEFSPLAQLDPDNIYAYKVIIEDEGDVDNINITNISGDNYQLYIKIVADETDIYDNPDNVDVGISAAYTDIFPDLYPGNSVDGNDSGNDFYGTQANTPLSNSKWKYKYGLIGYNTNLDNRDEAVGYSGFKGSFITIAHEADYYLNGANYQTSASIGEINEGSMGSNYIFHFPFLNYGFIEPETVAVIGDSIVEGCTDPAAVNYNPDATTDDGSCTDCSSSFQNPTSLNFNAASAENAASPFQAIKFGMVRYTTNLDSGNAQATIDHPTTNTTTTYLSDATAEELNIFNNVTTKQGGIILSDNHIVGETAEWTVEDEIPKFVVRIQDTPAGNAMTSLLNNLGAGGEDHTVWNLRIRTLTDANLSDSAIQWSNPIYNTDLGGALTGITDIQIGTPSSFTDPGPIIYSSNATGGTILAPEWDNIVTETAGTWSRTNLLAGLPYIIQLSIEADSTCDSDSGNLSEYVMVGVFWVGICSCANVGNDYYASAINGFNWSWTGNNSFPVFNLITNITNPGSGNFNCTLQSQSNGGITPDFGDNTFIGYSVGANSNICYQIDNQLTNCDEYFESCILYADLTCVGASELPPPPYTIEVLTSGGYITEVAPDTYQFGISGGYITTQIDGIWNPVSNTYDWVPNLNYTIYVYTPGGDTLTQTQVDATVNGLTPDQPAVYQNEFQVDEVGQYTIEIVINDPYPGEFSDTVPCSQEYTINLTSQCPTVVLGCTDPASSNYNPQATLDDGTCDDGGCGEEIINNPVFTTTLTPTNMTSTCEFVEVVVGGVTIGYEVPTPDTSTGSITVEVNYIPDIYAVDSFAIALGIPGSQSLYSFVGSYLDSFALTFQSYPDQGGDSVTSIPGVGYWSPLISTTSTAGPYTFTFNQSNTGGALVPGTYYVLVIPNLPNIETNLTDCTSADILLFESAIQSVTLNMTPPDEPCTPPCVNPDPITGVCDPWVTGCTDPDAENYDENATLDDGSCEEPPSFCEDNPDNEDCVDCTDAQNNLPAGGRYKYKTGKVNEVICDPTIPSEGECTDPNACNYNPDAPLDASNNLICDYCSCTDPVDDPDCVTGDPCDPTLDPDCIQVPICPDPENPACEPIIENPCPEPGDCEPPPPPCVILGDCPPTDECLPGEDCGCPEGENCDPYIPDSPVVEVPCTFSGQAGGFSIVQEQAFACMSDEGKRLMFRLKAGSQYEREDIIKLSLISYLFAGGLEGSLLDCLFNCNDTMFSESKQKSMVKDCQTDWAKGGGRIWNGNDSYARGSMVVYIRMKQGVMTRNIYTAERNIEPNGIHPGFPQSGWKRCYSTRLQTKTNVATGEENYLQTFYEFMTRMCTSCTVQDKPGSAAIPDPANLIDPKKLDNYLNPQDNSNGDRLSGILGADGQEIII